MQTWLYTLLTILLVHMFSLLQTKNPARDLPIGILGAMAIVTSLYVLMSTVLVMMIPVLEIPEGASFAVAFELVGMRWCKYIVALGALAGIITTTLVRASKELLTIQVAAAAPVSGLLWCHGVDTIVWRGRGIKILPIYQGSPVEMLPLSSQALTQARQDTRCRVPVIVQ